MNRQLIRIRRCEPRKNKINPNDFFRYIFDNLVGEFTRRNQRLASSYLPSPHGSLCVYLSIPTSIPTPPLLHSPSQISTQVRRPNGLTSRSRSSHPCPHPFTSNLSTSSMSMHSHVAGCSASEARKKERTPTSRTHGFGMDRQNGREASRRPQGDG
jgi:hypothetical protein